VNFGNETTPSTITTTCVDCLGQILSPGFIDVQLNGAFGVDFLCIGKDENALAAKDVLNVAQRLVATGTTSFCPTMVSSSSATYRSAIKTIGKAREMKRISHNASHCPSEEASKAENGEGYIVGANILGMHLEGPFFASAKKGAHDPCNIFSPSGGMTSVLETYCLINNDNEVDDRRDSDSEEGSTFEDIDIVTLAPELPGAYEVIRSLTTGKRRRQIRPVVVTLGHTDATYDDGLMHCRAVPPSLHTYIMPCYRFTIATPD
jgi:N-acetylglucosamine-6-phosphate deacetylase